MSYDLTIRADRAYSQFVPLEPLREFIGRLPHVRPNGTTGFILDDPPRRWMNISLEVAGEDVDSIAVDEDGRLRVNCIRLHIPYEYLGDAAERDYFPVAAEIAGLLHWRLYDCQTGKDVPASPRPDAKRDAFYREVLGALGLSEPTSGGRGRRRPSGAKKKPGRGKPRKSS
jgi:hypothetical protein